MENTGNFDNYDDRTIIFGGNADERLSAEELRKLLELPKGDEISDYSDIASIGLGGLGAVFSVREPGLNREIALKVLRPEFRNNPAHIERFIREARATAQIDHPSVVPVHRIGVFDDVGVYFTMKRIEGETLRSVIKNLADRKPEYLRRFSLRRRLEIFIAICQGVAFSHRKGILHCDLKPSNIMIGDYGEVLIMDWGLARYRQEKDQSINGKKMSLDIDGDFPYPEPDPEKKANKEINGTPAYMPPEQAAGRNDYLDERADIYSLGAILYSLLTLEPAPFDIKLDTNELLGEVILGRVVRPRRRAPLLCIPRELEAITMKAMARRRVNRYKDVQGLIDDVRNFLESYPVKAYAAPPFYRLIKLCTRRPLIPITLLAALLTLGGVFLFKFFVDQMKADSQITLAHDNIIQSDAYYMMALRSYHQLQFESGAASNEALRRKKDLTADYNNQRLEFYNRSNVALDALASLDVQGIRRSEILRTVGEIMVKQLRLPIFCENYEQLRPLLLQFRARWRNSMDEILKQNAELAVLMRRIDENEGLLTVEFPENAEVAIRAFGLDEKSGEKEFRWQPVTGSGSINKLKSGSYLIRARRADTPAIFYPVIIGPAARSKIEIEFPPFFPAGMVMVPAGKFQYDLNPSGGARQKIMLPDYFIRKHEVTIAEYLEFWTRIGDPEKRRRFTARHIMADNQVVDLWDADGRLIEPFRPDLPVTGITGEAAAAYCADRSRRTGQICRLPSMMEQQKAARGVDGRTYVWGNRFLPDAALVRENARAALFPVGAPPETFAGDVSSYGVYDLAGNVREFVRSTGESDGIYLVAGGSYRTSGPSGARCDASGSSGYLENDIGFRYVIEIPRSGMLGELADFDARISSGKP